MYITIGNRISDSLLSKVMHLESCRTNPKPKNSRLPSLIKMTDRWYRVICWRCLMNVKKYFQSFHEFILYNLYDKIDVFHLSLKSHNKVKVTTREIESTRKHAFKIVFEQLDLQWTLRSNFLQFSSHCFQYGWRLLFLSASKKEQHQM